jgi:hypothetical protein
MASSAKASTPRSSTPKAAANREPTVKSTPAEKSTPTRNTSVPPKAKANGKVALAAGVVSPVTREMIAERAYHLWLSGAPGGEFEHWCAAERELNGGK